MPDSGRPRISVLLPVRNAGSSLEPCLDSLLSQDHPSFEILAVDDGSTDTGPALLAARACRDPRLHVIRQTALGLVAALEHGLSRSRGEWIARMDSDDIALPGRLTRQSEWLERNPATGLVSCRVIHGGSAGQAGYARHVEWLNTLQSAEEIRLARFIDSPLAHPSVLFRRELPVIHGSWRAGDFPEDWELWLRWLDAGVVMEKVPEALLVWNDPPERLSRRDPRYGPDAFNRVRRIWLARELERCLDGRPVFSWGSGRESRRRVTGLPIAAWLDLDPRRIGQTLWGVPVRHRDSLLPGEAFVLANVGRTDARADIRRRLEARGYREGRDWLALA